MAQRQGDGQRSLQRRRGRRSLPGGRLTAPLSQFQTGFGQKFDRGRQSVFKVEVTATEPDGTASELKWGPIAAAVTAGASTVEPTT